MIIKESQLTKNIYQPNDIVKMLGCTVRTVQNYCDSGKIKSYRSSTNRRMIDKQDLVEFLIANKLYENDKKNEIIDKKDIIYTRVSTNKQAQRGDLDRQIEKISSFAITQNPINLKIIKDIGSGLNDSRKKLLELIDMIMNDEINRIFIMYKDRLTRFGYNYIKSICDKHNVDIIIVATEQNDKSIQEELAEDIISIIHSFSGKLYGMRKTVKEKINKELEE